MYMGLAVKIKLFFIIFAAFGLWQGFLAAPKIFLFFGGLSLLFFLLFAFFSPSPKQSKGDRDSGSSSHLSRGRTFPPRLWIYRLRSSLVSDPAASLFLYLPILFFFFFVRLLLLPEVIIPPEGWYKSPNSLLSPNKVGEKPRKLYVRGSITSVLKPGVYLADLEILKVKRRGLKRETSLEAKQKSLKKETPLFIPVYLKVNDYYLLSSCRIWLTLKGKALPQRLPQNSFGSFIKRKGAISILRLSRKDIYRKDCRRLDLRGRFQDMLGRTLYKSGFSLHQRGVAMGLLLGRSGYMQFDLKKKAVELGILHLFAASGLHMGIFYLCFYWPLSRLRGKKSKLALTLPLLPCFGYMFFLGFPVSLLRAFTFLSFHALQSFFVP